jgi:hypothetical protein
MGLGTGNTLKQPFTSTVEDYNFIRLPTQYPDEPRLLILFFLLNSLSCKNKVELYLPMGEGANKPAKAPTAADPKAINPSGMVAAVLMLK